MYTPTWQFSFLPSRPHHCRCTPTEAVGLAQVGTDLPGERQEQGLVAPGDKAEELLEALPFLVMQVGNPFAGLVLEFREQAGQVLDGVPALLGLGKRRGEWQNEGLETRRQTLDHFRRHLGLRQHLLQPGVESPIHNEPPFREASVTEEIISNAVVTNQGPRYSRTKHGAFLFR
jgi:hypothetical protein